MAGVRRVLREVATCLKEPMRAAPLNARFSPLHAELASFRRTR
jgi:hypothetical protein